MSVPQSQNYYNLGAQCVQNGAYACQASLVPL